MRFKNNLKSKVGQASLEYFIILAAILLISLISLSTFLPKLRETIQGSGGYFQKVGGRIINADQG